MKSNTKINKQLKGKRNPELVDAIIQARKSEAWKRVSEILATPRKNSKEKNIDAINKFAQDGETIVVPGKVLSVGELDKKINVVAFGFSKNAEEKIKKSGGKAATILEEIKKNPEGKGIRIFE
jgi:large subunit ribosomal protein L18e